MHISSNLTKHLELELEQLKEEHQNLNLDYQQLRSDHQNLTLDHKKLKESHKQLKDLMYTYMGGYFKCLVFKIKMIVRFHKTFKPFKVLFKTFYTMYINIKLTKFLKSIKILQTSLSLMYNLYMFLHLYVFTF